MSKTGCFLLDDFHLLTGGWRLLVGKVDEERDRSANSLLRPGPGQVLHLTSMCKQVGWAPWLPPTWTGSPPDSESAKQWARRLGNCLLRPTWSSSDDWQALITSNKQTSWNIIRSCRLNVTDQCSASRKRVLSKQTDVSNVKIFYAFIGFPMMLNWLLMTLLIGCFKCECILNFEPAPIRMLWTTRSQLPQS